MVPRGTHAGAFGARGAPMIGQSSWDEWRSLPARSRWLVVSFGLLAIALYAYGLDADFVFGHDGWCAARRGIAGNNLVRYGFIETRFAHIRNPDYTPPQLRGIYWHHPHGMQLLIGLSYKLFGRGEWQTRLIPFLSMVASLGMWWGITWRLIPSALARATSMLVFLTMPMLVVYGVFVNMDPLVLCASIGAAWLFVRYEETPSWRRGLACFALAFVASYSGWSWFLFAALLCSLEVGLWITHRRFSLRWLSWHCSGTLLGFVAIVSHLVMLEGSPDPRTSFRNLFMQRSTQGGRITFLDALKAQEESLIKLFTPGLLLVGAIGLLVIVVSLLRVRFALRQGLALVFLATGVGFVAVFTQGASVHDFWSSIAAPYFPLVAADLVARAEGLAGTRFQRALTAGWALAIALQVAYSLGMIVQRREYPDIGHPAASNDHQQRNIVVWKWLHDHSRSGRPVLLDRRNAEGTTGPQRSYYMDRVERHVDMLIAPLGQREGAEFALLDMRRFPVEALAKTLTTLIEHYRLTVIDTFVVVHLKEPVQGARVTYLRSQPEYDSALSAWLRTTQRAATKLVQDDLLKAEFFLYAGLPELAKQAYAARSANVKDGAPDDVHHRVADHNLALLSGKAPPTVKSWLPRVLPSCPGVRKPLEAVRTEAPSNRIVRATAVLAARPSVDASPLPYESIVVTEGGRPPPGVGREHLAVPLSAEQLPVGGLIWFDAVALQRRAEGFSEPRASVVPNKPVRNAGRPPVFDVPCGDPPVVLPRWLRRPLGLGWLAP
ncbi:MAG: glycosyltransferase family 39 protein [Myxococcales bacterium]